MTTHRSAIFRVEAIRNHEQGYARPTATQIVPAWAVPLLWGLLGLLAASGLVFYWALATTHLLGE